MMIDLLALSPQELVDILHSLGQPSYRAHQLFSWLHKGASFDEMSDLPKTLRARLSDLSCAGTLVVETRESAPDGTRKLGLRTRDREIIETVFIPHGTRNTVCLSSQLGCAFGCPFCATGQSGLLRNLTTGEIVEQVIKAQPETDERISNVVFMGMGEPLVNYPAVVKAVRLLTCKEGLNIGARHIAISTCGLPEQIRRLARENLPVSLAISLHATTDVVRNQLVPLNRKHPISDIIAAAQYYFQNTGRKIAFQYVVTPGLNDTPEQAAQLAALTRGLPSLVNLIPLNPLHPGGRADTGPAQRYCKILCALGVNAVVRRSRGGEVLGACGQLRTRTRGQG